MKKLLLLALLFPTVALADGYDDINSSLREVLIGLSQVSVQGKDAALYSQIQQGLVQVQKGVEKLKKEHEVTVKELDTKKAEHEKAQG